MGRGRGKGRKITVSNNEDSFSGEEEKIPVQKRRGRPQKPLLKEEIYEAEPETTKIEEEEDTKSESASENNAKRKRNLQAKNTGEDGSEKKLSTVDDSGKSNGFRQAGSRRKSTPRRAAEAVVECR